MELDGSTLGAEISTNTIPRVPHYSYSKSYSMIVKAPILGCLRCESFKAYVDKRRYGFTQEVRVSP